MAAQSIECFVCGARLKLKEGRPLKPTDRCPKCDELLAPPQQPPRVQKSRPSRKEAAGLPAWLLPAGAAAGVVLIVGVLIGLTMWSKKTDPPIVAAVDPAAAANPSAANNLSAANGTSVANGSMAATGSSVANGPGAGSAANSATSGAAAVSNSFPLAANGSGHASESTAAAMPPSAVPRSGDGRPANGAAASASQFAANEFGTNGNSSTSRLRTGTGPQDGRTDQPLFRYTWSDGDEYFYRYELTTKLGETKRETNGSCTIKVLNREQVGTAAGPISRSTGTGFVVRPDGVLITCAHVVEEVTTVEVHLDGKTYQAQVLKVDPAQDLAVLKIPATGLTSLPLTDSDKVPLGEEVRAIGYPLTDILGSGLKITQGTISGRNVEGGQDLLQVDATINPGNSGGPLLNMRGEVVGITSAKIGGSNVSYVGLTVPANQAEVLLRSAGVAAQGQGAGKMLTGPELAKAVTPAVALLRVTSRPVVHAKVELSFGGSHTTLERRATPFGGPPSFPGISSAHGRLQMTARGEVLELSDVEGLPYLFGPAVQLPLIPLPPTPKAEWSEQRTQTITRIISDSRSPFGRSMMPRGLRPPGFPGMENEKVEQIPAIENETFRVTGEDDERIVLQREYKLITTEGSDQPRYSLSYSGMMRYNKQRGTIDRCHYEGEFVQNADQVSVRLPVTFDLRLLTPEEMQEEKARLAKSQAEQKEKERQEALPPSGSERDQLLADLVGGNDQKIDEALRALAKKEPAGPDDEIAKAIAAQLTVDKPFRKSNATQALQKWVTPAVYAEVNGQILKEDPLVHLYLPKVLAKMQDPDSIPPLIDLMSGGSSARSKAERMLKEIGPLAEEAVLSLIDHQDKDVMIAAFGLLADIGTAKSLPALQRKAGTLDGYHKIRAEMAVKGIEKRGP